MADAEEQTIKTEDSLLASKKQQVQSEKWANQRLDELLGYGKYQKFQVWAFLGLCSFVGAMNYFHPMFLVTKKMHRCALPESLEERYGHLANVTGKYAKQCTTFVYTETSCLPSESDLSSCFDLNQEEIACSKYVHDMSSDDAFWSLASEYDWVCDKNEYGSNVLVAQNIGIIITALIFMQLSDTLGRSPVFHATNIIYLVMRIIGLHVTQHYWVFLILMAIGSTYAPLGIRIGYTLAAELTNEKGRLWVYMVGWITWVAGVAFLPLLAWLMPNWYTFGITVPLINLVFIPFIWLTPESPRLLLTKGKVNKATDIVQRSRRINGVKNESWQELHTELTAISRKIRSQEKVYGVISLFKSKRLAMYTILLSILWVVNDFLYIGGQLNVENLAGNQFVNFAIVGLTELPSVFIGEFIIGRMGRRWGQTLCQFLTTLVYAVIIACLLSGISGAAITGLAIVGKTVSNVGWFIMWVQAVELFPTTLRVTGSNFAALVANILCTAAPYIILLGDTNLPLMYTSFLIVGVIGTLAASFIPETFKQPFPDCIEEVETRPSHPYFSWRVWS